MSLPLNLEPVEILGLGWQSTSLRNPPGPCPIPLSDGMTAVNGHGQPSTWRPESKLGSSACTSSILIWASSQPKHINIDPRISWDIIQFRVFFLLFFSLFETCVLFILYAVIIDLPTHKYSFQTCPELHTLIKCTKIKILHIDCSIWKIKKFI